MSPPSRGAARIAIAAIGMVLALAVVSNGLAVWLKQAAPVTAARLAPGNADIAAAAARSRVIDPADIEAPAVRASIETALERDVTITGAIELRASQFDASGDGARAARLFALSDAISRRSLPTRLWLIQRSVDRGDVPGALANFDIALRTSEVAPEILFPILAGATSDAALAGPIARLLDRPSDWRVMFLNHAIEEGGDPADIGRVILRMRDRGVIVDNQVDQKLIAALVASAEFGLARRVHDALHPTIPNRPLVADPDFSRPGQSFPFGWGLGQDGEAWAARDVVDGRPALIYQSTSSGEGPVATQLLLLPAGQYRISARSAGAATDPASPPFWSVTCAGPDGPQIALLDQPVRTGALTSADFTVRADCAAQWLALNLRPSERAGGQAGAVASVSVIPSPLQSIRN